MSLDLFQKFGLTKQQYNLLIHFEELIFDWNKKINLISRKDINNFKTNHIAHSLSTSFYFKFFVVITCDFINSNNLIT